MAKSRFRFPLWAKALLAFAFSAISVGAIAVIISSRTLINITRDQYIDQATHLADTLGIYVDLNDVKAVKNAVDAKYVSIPESEKVSNEEWDTPEYKEYVAHFDSVLEMPEYDRLLDALSLFHAKNEAKYTSLGYADFENKRMVYLVDDAPIEERCAPGTYDEFTESDMTVFDHMEEGFTPEISETEAYGHLVSVGRPIFDEDGKNIVAFGLIDLSMDKISSRESQQVLMLGLVLGGVAVAATLIGFILVMYLVIHPLRKLTKTANEYMNVSSGTFDKFSNVQINSHDELGDLVNAVKKMEKDINHYVSDLLAAEEAAEQMRQIADIDALTHLGNKRAYYEVEEKLNAKIKEGDVTFAITMVDLNDLKLINDKLGHEKGDEAIAELARIIKESFPLSETFRIGGDEFVAISQGEGIANLEECENRFATLCKESKIHLSAAIGSAKFDAAKDNNVEDVFKRADFRMYSVKKQMKSNANPYLN